MRLFWVCGDLFYCLVSGRSGAGAGGRGASNAAVRWLDAAVARAVFSVLLDSFGGSLSMARRAGRAKGQRGRGERSGERGGSRTQKQH